MSLITNNFDGQKILVTGASGFVGSRLVEMLLNCKAEVIGLVEEDASTKRISALLDNPEFHLVKCSLDYPDHLSTQLLKWGDIDYLVHLWLKVPESHDFYHQCIMDINLNLIPTINLIKAVGSCLKGICFASSVSVYGYQPSIPVKETDYARPISSYGATKLAIENYLRAYGELVNIPVTVLRYSSIYGPGELGHRAIPNFIKNIIDGKPPVINGDGSEIRDYVYVDDVARATAMTISVRPDTVLNIGSGQGHSILEIARLITSKCQSDICPEIKGTGRQKMDFVCDISAAQEILSFSPQISFEDGLGREIDWLTTYMQKKSRRMTSELLSH